MSDKPREFWIYKDEVSMRIWDTPQIDGAYIHVKEVLLGDEKTEYHEGDCSNKCEYSHVQRLEARIEKLRATIKLYCECEKLAGLDAICGYCAAIKQNDEVVK